MRKSVCLSSVRSDVLPIITLSENEIELVHGGMSPEEVVKDIKEAEEVAEAIEEGAEKLGLNKDTAIKVAVGAFVTMLTVGASYFAYTRFRKPVEKTT